MNEKIMWYSVGGICALVACFFTGLSAFMFLYPPMPNLPVWILVGIPAPFLFAISAVFLSIPIGERLKTRRLKERGVRIKTKYLSSSHDFKLKMGYKYPYIIRTASKDPETGATLVFESDRVWDDPDTYIKEGQEIDVISDPSDPHCYKVDLSFLPDEIKRPFDYLLT